MNCHEADRLLQEELDGRLDAEGQRQLQAHRAECRRCRDARTAFDRLVAAAGQLPTPGPSPDLVDRIVAAAKSPTLRRQRRRHWPIWAAAAAAAFVLAIVLSPPRRPHVPTPRPTESRVNVAQLVGGFEQAAITVAYVGGDAVATPMQLPETIGTRLGNLVDAGLTVLADSQTGIREGTEAISRPVLDSLRLFSAEEPPRPTTTNEF